MPEARFLRITKGDVQKAEKLEKAVKNLREKTEASQKAKLSKRAIIIQEHDLRQLRKAQKLQGQCDATTLTGKKCTCRVVGGSRFCRRHGG